MLQTRTLVTRTKIEGADFATILLRLVEKGWKPALLESQRTFLEIAGVADKVAVPIRSTTTLARRLVGSGRTVSAGDLFFREGELYYVANNTEAVQIALDRYIRGPYISAEEGAQPRLEVGVVSSNPDALDERLRDFALMLEDAIRSSLDGRKTRHMTFEWTEFQPTSPRLDDIIRSEVDETGLRFSRAQLLREEVAAAEVLSAKTSRDTLVELSRTGFARERDIVGRRTKNQEDIRDALSGLRRVGLVGAEYVLECRQTNTPLTRLASPDQLENTAIGDLPCPACGEKFRQEVLSEGYTVTDLGRKMSRQSYWMTVWVTNQLVQLDVPIESILWNIIESGEEVDILVGLLGRLWIFELKDREFGAGDAYPLNYRQGRYQANRTFIVTTEKVSKDAKRVLQELAREAQRERGGPVYVEGLDAASDVLGREVSSAALQYANQRLALIGELSGYDLSAILAACFQEPMTAPLEEEATARFVF